MDFKHWDKLWIEKLPYGGYVLRGIGPGVGYENPLLYAGTLRDCLSEIEDIMTFCPAESPEELEGKK